MSQQPSLEAPYLQTRARIVGLITEAGAENVETMTVAACPEWSVRDLVAHLTGNCADVLSGNIDGAGTTTWTNAQVETRGDLPIRKILAEWEDLTPAFASLIDSFPGWYGVQVVADLSVHEHDIRGTLDRPGARASPGVWCCLDFLLTAIAHPTATALGLGPVEVTAGESKWVIGTAAGPSGDPNAAVAAALVKKQRPPSYPPTPVAAKVAAEPFELCRSLTGRRSVNQVRRLRWSTDPEPYMSLFGPGHYFRLRTTDLDE